MGVDYTAKIVYGVLLDDEKARQLTKYLNGSSDDDGDDYRTRWSFDGHRHQAGDYYGGGTETIIGFHLCGVDSGFAPLGSSLERPGLDVELSDVLAKYNEKFGWSLQVEDAKVYVGMLVH